MSLWRQLTRGLRVLTRRRDADRDLSDEVQHYLDQATAAHIGCGLSPANAARAARLELGGATSVREQVRGYGWESLVTSVLADLRYAMRALRRNIAFAGLSTGILVIGIGASTAVFQLANALLLQPLPVDSPHELLEIWNANPHATSDFERYAPLSYPEYAYLRDHRDAFTDLLALDGDPTFLSWKHGQSGALVQAQFVSTNFFSVLHLNAATGRTFAPSDEQLSGASVAVVSDAFWRQRLGADPKLSTIPFVVNGQPFTIVGVAPPTFSGLIAGLTPDVWLPIPTVERVRHESGMLSGRNTLWLIPIGRLAPRATLAQAVAELAVQGHEYAKGDRDLSAQVATPSPAEFVPGPFRRYVTAFVVLLQIVVVMMLVIAGANAANLALAQAASRRPEMAIRASLGASRGRLLRQMLTETVILALIAGGGGLLAAYILTPILLRLIPSTLPLHLHLATDWRVIAFAVLLALASGIALGWAPALRATSDLMTVIRGDSLGGRRRSRLRNTLVVVQVAVSLVLLIAGALCWRSLTQASAIDPGFATDHRVFAKLDLKTLGYPDSSGRQFYKTLIARVNAVPGVTSASTANYLPLETTNQTTDISIPGQPLPSGGTGFVVQTIAVGPAYFSTMGTRVVRGREFDERDIAGAAPVAVVNEAMAQRFWPNDDAIGQTITEGTGSDRMDYRVIGVVRTGKYRTLGERPHPVFFRSIAQHYQPRAVLVVHASTSTGATLKIIRDEVARIDPDLVVIQASSLDQQLSLALFPTRVTGTLFTIIGAIGLCLALAGLSGLVAYSVATRTKEIGIRMALGAQRGTVVAQFVGEGGRLLVIGIVIGSALAFAATRALAGVLFGTSATDPLVFIGVILLLFLSALSACWFMARRAAAIDPMTALHRE